MKQGRNQKQVRVTAPICEHYDVLDGRIEDSLRHSGLDPESSHKASDVKFPSGGVAGAT